MFDIDQVQIDRILDGYKALDKSGDEKLVEEIKAKICKYENKEEDEREKARARVDFILMNVINGNIILRDIEWLCKVAKLAIDEVKEARAKSAALARELMKTTLRPPNSQTNPTLKF